MKKEQDTYSVLNSSARHVGDLQENRKKVLRFLILLFTLLPLAAQSQLLDPLPNNQALSNDQVTCITQDHQGFLWVGTSNGLNRFDAYQCSVFKNQLDNPQSISDNTINAIFIDRSGTLWVGTNGGLNRYDHRTESFEHFRHDPQNTNSLSHNEVHAIYEDSEDVLWVCTDNGLNKLDRESQHFINYQHDFQAERLGENHIVDELKEYVTSEGRMLVIGYFGIGPKFFDPRRETFHDLPSSRLIQWTYDIDLDEENQMRMVGAETFFEYEKKEGRLIEKSLFEKGQKVNYPLTAINKNINGQLLLGTKGHGLLLADTAGNILDRFFIENDPLAFNRANWITTIFKDSGSAFWIGTLKNGLWKLDLANRKFTNYLNQVTPLNGLPGNSIRGLTETQEGNILIGTREHGIVEFDPIRQIFLEEHQFNNRYPNWIRHNEVGALHRDQQGRILLGSWGKGPSVYLPEEHITDYFGDRAIREDSNLGKYISSFCETQAGELWIGMPEGIWVLPADDLGKGAIRVYDHSKTNEEGGLSHDRVRTIFEDHQGQVWVGTVAGGLNLWHRESDTFTSFKHDSYQLHSLSSNQVNTIFEDSQNRLWIGTQSGLNLFDSETQRFEHYLEIPEIKEADIRAMQEDDHGNLWLSTSRELIKFAPDQRIAECYDARDGIWGNNFNTNVFLKHKETHFFFIGSQNGLTVFHPDSIKKNTFIPPVWITALKRYKVEEGKTIEVIERGMSQQEEIELSYKNNILTFEFTALNFRNSDKNRYAYQLEGFNNNWTELGTNREVTFTNLDAGDYVLRVRGSNNDRVWNEKGASLKIRITPPWWKTTVAYWSYLFLISSILYGVYYFLRRRLELQNQLALEQQEAARLKELDSFKSKLYTNLTHEFRTPLTIIMGMAGQIKADPSKYLEEGARLIETNGENLLRLINQLLDLSRLENQSFQLQLQQKNIMPYLRYVTEAFQTFANSKNLALRFFTTIESLVMDYDPEQIKQVMTNLISNAVKFTPSGGSIKVWVGVKKENLQIEVKDTGRGIATADLPYIFDRFYQVDGSTTRKEEGTGIGLAHTRELVKIMGGAIEVESELGKGTSLRICLPIRRESPILETIETKKIIWNPSTSTFQEPAFLLPVLAAQADLPQLLIIEDNPDVVIYLKACLADLYRLDIAYNGKVGIEKALETIPDLIISDVMMPEQDGFQVCDFLKNDERTSHIPFVLLTAKADVDSKIAGLRRGADAYLSKPFDKEELMVRLKMLVEKQKRLISYFSKKIQLEKEDNLYSETDEALLIEDAFIQKVRQIVADHYADEDFALPQLCQKIGMSRSQLFRKMKALIATSPSEFIRSYRLNRARHLLETTDLTVSEAAWQTGYKDLAHFSKSFQDAFNVLPSAICK